MITKKEMKEIVREQLCLDYNCTKADFLKEENTVNLNELKDGRRVYESDGCFMKMIVFGERAIIAAHEDIKPWMEENFIKRNTAWMFDYGNLRRLDNKLKEYGHKIDGVRPFYLPNMEAEEVQPITEIKWFDKEEIQQFKGDERFDEAFIFDENCPDTIGLAAIEDGKIIGMAGATEDCSKMYQLGINVDPDHRGRGIATNLIALMKQEVLRRGFVPFYGTAISHISSINVALKAGFYQGWTEISTEKTEE